MLAEAVETASEVAMAWSDRYAVGNRLKVAKQAYGAVGKMFTLMSDLFFHQESKGTAHGVVMRVKIGGSANDTLQEAAAVEVVAEATGEKGPAITRLNKDGSAQGLGEGEAEEEEEGAREIDHNNPATWPSAVHELQRDKQGFMHLCGTMSRASDTLRFAERAATGGSVAFVPVDAVERATELSAALLDGCMKFMARMDGQPEAPIW